MATDRLNEKQLAAIESRAKAATPGPWERDELLTVWGRSGSLVVAELVATPPDDAGPDADFIAHAREDAPSLVAEVRRQRAENLDLRARLKAICSQVAQDVHHEPTEYLASLCDDPDLFDRLPHSPADDSYVEYARYWLARTRKELASE